MKEEVSKPVMIGIIVAVVLVVALIGWKLTSDNSGPKTDIKTIKARKDAKDGGE